MQSNDAQLTSHEKSKFKIPEYARAFWNQAPMIQNASDTDIMITYDKDNTGRKAYALFDNIASFYKDIHISNRNAYELIQENKRCPLHLDVEWYGLEDVSREQLGCIVHELRGYCFKELNRNIDINVLISSRLVNGNFKNSYHIASPTVVFDNNQDGTMKEFVDEFRKVAQFDFAPNGCVDMSIYTKNRNMRLPHCCKFGSDVPFIRISNDALEDDFTGRYDDPSDEDSYAPFILTNPEINGDVIQLHSNPSIQSGAQVKSKKRSKDDNESGPTTAKKVHKSFDRNQCLLPFQMSCVRELLVSAGDNVSVPTNANYLPDEKQWQIQCDQSKQLRCCLAKTGTTHTNNNCLIFVSQCEAGFRISYQCMASECSHCVKPVLGYVNFVDWNWQTSVLPLAKHHTVTPPLVSNSIDTIEDEEMHQSDDEPEDTLPDMLAVQIDLQNPTMNTYEMVKERHEKECFFIDSKSCFLRHLLNGKDIAIMQINDVINHYRRKYYFETKTDGSHVKRKFIQRWLDDDNIRMFYEIVVSPVCTATAAYNIWKPFKASLLPAVDDSLISKCISLFYHHVHYVITDQNKKYTDWVMDYLANIMQRPERKTQVAISLFGLQGCGKGILFDLFRKEIMGDFTSFQTNKPEETLVGKFAMGFIHRALVQIDEVKNLHSYGEDFKNFITCSELSFTEKGKNSIVVDNLTNLILTSNNADALHVDSDDRRFVLFRCSSLYKGNKEYFEALSDHVSDPENARGIYQYLMGRDLSTYKHDFQSSRPITDFYKETRYACISVVNRCISGMNKQDKMESLTGTEFYEYYKRFHIAGGYKNLLTLTAFGTAIGHIGAFGGITKKKTRYGVLYEFDKERILAFLQESNTYDEDAEFLGFELSKN